MMPKHKLPPWLRPKTPEPKLAVGVSWYAEEEWGEVKAAAVDKEVFEESYAEWVRMAEDALADLRATGINAEKVYIDSDSLLAWCLAHGKPNDSASRAQFVSEQGRNAKTHGA